MFSSFGLLIGLNCGLAGLKSSSFKSNLKPNTLWIVLTVLPPIAWLNTRQALCVGLAHCITLNEYLQFLIII